MPTEQGRTLGRRSWGKMNSIAKETRLCWRYLSSSRENQCDTIPFDQGINFVWRLQWRDFNSWFSFQLSRHDVRCFRNYQTSAIARCSSVSLTRCVRRKEGEETTKQRARWRFLGSLSSVIRTPHRVQLTSGDTELRMEKRGESEITLRVQKTRNQVCSTATQQSHNVTEDSKELALTVLGNSTLNDFAQLFTVHIFKPDM